LIVETGSKCCLQILYCFEVGEIRWYIAAQTAEGHISAETSTMVQSGENATTGLILGEAACEKIKLKLSLVILGGIEIA
jgi:hypothetical protein